MFADIILPLALPKRTYTYSIPESLLGLIGIGIRVEVQFGKSRLYSGIIEHIHDQKPDYPTKSIISVLDEVSLITAQQIKLWEWIAAYYCCTLGEVMAAALPGHLKLMSETRLVFHESYGDDFSTLTDEEYLIAEGLLIQKEMTVEDARKILNKKTVFPIVQSLINKGVLFLREDLQDKYKPRKITGVRLALNYRTNPTLLREIMNELTGKERQLEIVVAYLALEKRQPAVRKRELLLKADVSESSLKTLIKKGIFETYDLHISRLSGVSDPDFDPNKMTDQQEQAVSTIQTHFQTKQTVLLHGVTGSGKTRVYIELMKSVIESGGQVLYLLPEIALTTQVIYRLQAVFGSSVQVYHSKVNTHERVEVWKAAAEGRPIILGARSSLFLPFKDLQLIIVDEEHDSSFKQYDPAPRYHARDTAVYLAHLHGAQILLGTATPSLETWHNVLQEKYGYAEMKTRYGGIEMPEIRTVDLKELTKTKQMKSIFSPELIDNLLLAKNKEEQAILFQNRRGYAPVLECQVCAWTSQCIHCDVSLTYHKGTDKLRCHYCNYVTATVNVCPACGSGKIGMKGYGTEKIEDELPLFIPSVRTGRMDMDTASSKTNLMALLNDFEEQQIDVLVGTQMVTKGLDFDNVAIVGVLGADQLTRFPDFRAGERTYQLLTQVAGRAGRKKKRGLVLIQAFDTTHPVIQEVIAGDFHAFATRELAERKTFKYPPYYRLIHLDIRHKDTKVVNMAAHIMAKALRDKLGDRVLGPVIPNIARIRGLFGQHILLKLEKDAVLAQRTKQLILDTSTAITAKKGFAQVSIAVDVDPM